jgi:hypothetical protein
MSQTTGISQVFAKTIGTTLTISILDQEKRHTVSYLGGSETWFVVLDNGDGDGTYWPIGYSKTPPRPDLIQIPHEIYFEPLFLNEFSVERYPGWSLEERKVTYTSKTLERTWIWMLRVKYDSAGFQLGVWPD